MTVKELITRLLDSPMNEEVLLCYDKEHIDKRGEKCIGYCFNIDDVQGSEIMFTDWRDTEPSYNSVNSLAESKLKNPKAKTFDILRFVADNAGLSTFEAIEKAYNMGVSEQKPILDKIRAEIEKIAKPNELGGRGNGKSIRYGLCMALEIIDKYKADKKPTCGNCKEWGTVNCTETYREPTENDDICDSFKAESEDKDGKID